MEKIRLETRTAKEFLDISQELQEQVTGKHWEDGILTVFVPHTSAAVTINENADPDVPKDILAHFQALVPRDGAFRHAEGNSDAHILATLCGASVQVLVERGELALGAWQAVFFCEFDGPRQREVWLKFIPSGSGKNS